MNLFGLMEASGSAMQSERVRAEVVATNMANAETTRTEAGGPYHRQHVIFAANGNASFADLLGNAAGNAMTPGLLPLATQAEPGCGRGAHLPAWWKIRRLR